MTGGRQENSRSDPGAEQTTVPWVPACVLHRAPGTALPPNQRGGMSRRASRHPTVPPLQSTGGLKGGLRRRPIRHRRNDGVNGNGAHIPEHWRGIGLPKSTWCCGFRTRVVLPELAKRLLDGERTQNSALPGVRGKGITSRILAMPVMNWMTRSNPRPNPACGTVPKRRRSRYHQ